MTMLDDDRLASLLARAGAAFEVPATGRADILDRAAGRAPTAPDGGAPEESADPDDTADTADTADTEDAADAAVGERRQGRVRRITGVAGRHRVLAVAACVLVALVLAGAVGAWVRSPPTHRPLEAGLPPEHVATPGPTTTVAPGSSSGEPSAASRDAAPLQTKNAAPNGTAFGGTAGHAGSGATGSPALPKSALDQSGKIQQTGSLTLTVSRGDLGRTVTRLTDLAAAYGGFVANSQTQSGATAGNGGPSGSVTLQVPVGNFTPVLTRAKALGRTSDLTTKATDVTGQYVDLQSRLTALQDTRQQYLTILAKATTVGDILSVQEQIDAVQQQIEQLQGQLQLLASQTSYSTLTVSVSEGAPATSPSSLPESGLVRAWHASIGGFVAGVEGVIRIAGPLLFALLLAGAVLAGGRALWRRYQRHNL